MNDDALRLRLSRRALAWGGATILLAILLAALLVIPWPREALGRIVAPRQAADAAAVASQREASERAIARGYVKAADQLRRVRELQLAIGQEEAARIDAKARADLEALRRGALASVAAAVGLTAAQAEAYVLATDARLKAEGRLDVGPSDTEPGVLLAPRLFAIVARAGELFAGVADSATREITRAPSPTPGRPTASPSPSAPPR